MNARDFREHAISPTPRPRDWLVGALCVAAILAVIAAMQWADERSKAIFAAENAAIERTRAEMLPTLKAAYEQGQRDGVAGLAAGANGIEVAQTCMAWWFHPNINKQQLLAKACRGAKL